MSREFSDDYPKLIDLLGVTGTAKGNAFLAILILASMHLSNFSAF
ncbi:hypothetical protein [Paracidovorax oryzae]|nr:hypothetical protein [Paracidovorax oryzae]